MWRRLLWREVGAVRARPCMLKEWLHVQVNGQKVTLTAKEFDLLVTLARSPDRVFTRESLLDQVWGYTYLGDGRTVDVHIGTLRKKIEAIAGAPRDIHYIKTVWGVGYKFTLEDQE